MSTLSLNYIVNPTLTLSAAAQSAADFSSGLVLTHATGLPGGGRVQTFTDAAGVLAAFSSDTVLNQFASTYFGQDDFTPKSIKVGCKIATDADYTAAIAACLDTDPSFYGVAAVSDTSGADQSLLEAWCQANKKRFFFCTQESACLTPGDTTNSLYLAKTVAYSRSMGTYSDAASDAHANIHAAVMGFYLTTVYDQPNSIKTALMANFTGIGAAAVTPTQFEAIAGKTDGTAPGWNGNVYAKFGQATVLERGLSADGRFTDEGMALDWLLANLQVDMVNRLRSQRIPATDLGSAFLIDAAAPSLDKAARNGLLARGVWNFPGFGELNRGDTVSRGWYGFAQPVTSLSDADRAARRAPAITFALVGAGALQYCAPTVIFQR